MDLDNTGLVAARLAFDSVDLFSTHCGYEIDRELVPAMTIAAMRFSGVAGDADLAPGPLKDAADLIAETLALVDDEDLRSVVSELSAGGNFDVQGGQFSAFSGRPDLFLAAAIVHDAVLVSRDAEYAPMTDAVAFLADSLPGYRPKSQPGMVLSL